MGALSPSRHTRALREGPARRVRRAPWCAVVAALVATLVVGACGAGIGPPAATPALEPSASPLATLPVATASPSPTTSPSPIPSPSPTESADRQPTLAQLVGQKLVVRMDGRTPSADLLGRIGRGEVGGVILYAENITTPAALVELTAALRDAAVNGGQPALLIAVDQEGSTVKRIAWAPPTLSAPEMGADGRPATAHAQGASTGRALDGLGINVDLAPVVDVPGTTASFMAAQGRTFSSSVTTTSILADAFAAGLESNGVLATRKHFPGLGLAARNTDAHVVTIDASAATLEPGLEPYRSAIGDGRSLVMLSNATYPAYDPANAAAWSPAIATTLLRDDLGFAGVTITDSLDGTASARGRPVTELATLAASAGADLILTTGPEASSRAVYAALLRSATDGSIPAATLRASYDRILVLKVGL